jgi:Na+-transporting NADH:ubiquinone oxidoreductase subunit NqrD
MHLDGEPEDKTISSVVVSPVRFVNIPGVVVEENSEDKSINSLSSGIKQSKWKIVKESNDRILPRYSRGDIKLSNLIAELKKFSTETQAEKKEEISINVAWKWVKRSRSVLEKLLLNPKFHYFIIILVIIDLIVVLVDLVLGKFYFQQLNKKSLLFFLAQLSTPCLTEAEMEQYNTTVQRDSCLLPYSIHLTRGELFLFYCSVLFLVIFVSEVFISFYAFGWRHYKNPLYLSDGLIVFGSFIMEIYFHYGNIGRAGRAAAAIVVLRLWKIVRAIHAVAHSITLKNRLLIKKIQEAQVVIEEEKQATEQMLEKQEIKVEYLANLLKSAGKFPSPQQIAIYIDKTWKQRKQTN